MNSGQLPVKLFLEAPMPRWELSRQPSHTGIVEQYFLYHRETESAEIRKVLRNNEGEERRNRRELVSSPGYSRIKIH